MYPRLMDGKRYFQRMGAKGGRKRARTLPPERRRAIAQKAAETRWRGSRPRRLNRVVRALRRVAGERL